MKEVEWREIVWTRIYCLFLLIPFDETELGVALIEQEAFNHYKKNTMSIEVLKDDSLQKINFRVKNKVNILGLNCETGILSFARVKRFCQFLFEC